MFFQPSPGRGCSSFSSWNHWPCDPDQKRTERLTLKNKFITCDEMEEWAPPNEIFSKNLRFFWRIFDLYASTMPHYSVFLPSPGNNWKKKKKKRKAASSISHCWCASPVPRCRQQEQMVKDRCLWQKKKEEKRRKKTRTSTWSSCCNCVALLCLWLALFLQQIEMSNNAYKFIAAERSFLSVFVCSSSTSAPLHLCSPNRNLILWPDMQR